jgi:methylase of polypeptide subunit release factors
VQRVLIAPQDAAVGQQTHNAALTDLLQQLARLKYRFSVPTPLTHQRVLARQRPKSEATLTDIFGWNKVFDLAAVPAAILAAMQQADVLRSVGHQYCSAVRIASLGDDLFLHSAYPTTATDAVFFGPDTYRFASLIQQAVQQMKRENADQQTVRVLDIGCGSGAGAIAASRALSAQGRAASLVMSDINPLALHYSAINVAAAQLSATTVESDVLAGVSGRFDLILSNPPYLHDDHQRAYRHGGARLGRALSVRIVAQALSRLTPGGMLVLYTGVAIVGGIDALLAELQPLLDAAQCVWHYTELDPDVFGEELERPVYAQADRIAVVGLLATRARLAD